MGYCRHRTPAPDSGMPMNSIPAFSKALCTNCMFEFFQLEFHQMPQNASMQKYPHQTLDRSPRDQSNITLAPLLSWIDDKKKSIAIDKLKNFWIYSKQLMHLVHIKYIRSNLFQSFPVFFQFKAIKPIKYFDPLWCVQRLVFSIFSGILLQLNLEALFNKKSTSPGIFSKFFGLINPFPNASMTAGAWSIW